jgi:hypothetical protein
VSTSSRDMRRVMVIISSTEGRSPPDQVDCERQFQGKRPWATPEVIVASTNLTAQPAFITSATEGSVYHIGALPSAGPS